MTTIKELEKEISQLKIKCKELEDNVEQIMKMVNEHMQKRRH